MKRLELLISRARELSGNTRYDADSGVSQGVFTQYFQNAQDSLVKALSIAKCKYLLKTSDPIPVVSGQEFYDYPSDLFLRNIDTVEWNLTGTDTMNEGWVPLYKCISKDRFSSRTGYPFGYILQEQQFIISPPIDNGYLRIAYVRRPRDLQVRMGRVSAVTVAGGSLTALTIDPSEASFNPTALNEQNSLCVVNRDGTISADGIAYDSVNTTTGVFTLSSQALQSGQSISIGDYVCVGEFVVNRPEWPDIVESYLIDFAVYRAKYGDSSQWTQEAKDVIRNSQAELIQAFALMSDDVTDVPILCTDFLDIW